MTTRFHSPAWQFFLRRVTPGALLLATIATSLLAGVRFLDMPDAFLLRATAYAVAALLGIGAHACGHYLAARRDGVEASFPYFVPTLKMAGISGAYVKLGWPIHDRRVLLRIFTAGPLCGFAVSLALLAVGFALSRVAPGTQSGGVMFGDSLLTLGAQHLFFPGMTESDDLTLHSIGIAGYFGLWFTLLHLFPVGRFDGGRIVYAIFGYRPALLVSWLTIFSLAALGLLWPGWYVMSLYCALTLIRLTRQHPKDTCKLLIDREVFVRASLVAAIFLVTFMPTPIYYKPPAVPGTSATPVVTSGILGVPSSSSLAWQPQSASRERQSASSNFRCSRRHGLPCVSRAALGRG